MRMIGRYVVVVVSALAIQWSDGGNVSWWLSVLMIAAGLWGIEWAVLDRKKDFA